MHFSTAIAAVLLTASVTAELTFQIGLNLVVGSRIMPLDLYYHIALILGYLLDGRMHSQMF
jgi:hypothetical protein